MLRIGVIADAHANLPAAVAALDQLSVRGCATVFHAGDAIGIGPHPSEVLALLSEKRVRCVMGNHDRWFAFGLPPPRPPWMSEGEVEHQRWTHSQLSSAQRQEVRSWPYQLSLRLGTKTVAFLHYARSRDGEFETTAAESAADLDRVFAQLTADIVVFGHDHRPRDLSFEARRFLNPGSLGCHDRPEARALTLTETSNGDVEIEQLVVAYDDRSLLADFELRQVPERAFIRRTFITRTNAAEEHS